MARRSNSRDLNLKWLEIFRICAQKGSLQAAAEETGLTLSTVSYHLRSLEDHLGVELFNHARRPMVLTPKGTAFLRHIDPALHAIRRAKAEASTGTIPEAGFLRIGTIEDFDSDITPDLAVYLSSRMPVCDFMYHTGSSHAVIRMLRDRQLDLGVTTTPAEALRELQDRPLLRDPFVMILPLVNDDSLTEIVEGRTKLPFLRFSSNLMIAQQIEAQLRRIGLSAPPRFECSSHQTLMAMVAAGAGWTITTPLHFSRARRFHAQLRMHRFPGKTFSRTLAIVSTPDCSRTLVDLVDGKMRSLIHQHAIAPLQKTNPWLEESFALVT